jgi:hypothetical protein
MSTPTSPIDLTIEFDHFPKASFTTFWLKLSIFRPLYHPTSSIELPATCSEPQLTRFLLEHILHRRSIEPTLSAQESEALIEAREVARQSYETGPNAFSAVNTLASRMAFRDPDYVAQFGLFGNPLPQVPTLVVGGPGMPAPASVFAQQPPIRPPPPPANIFNNLFGPVPVAPAVPPALAANPVQPLTRPPKSHFHLGERLSVVLGHRNPRVTGMLMEDNELRLFAAREFPAFSKLLIPQEGVEFKIMMGYLNLAGKMKAENESLREALREKRREDGITSIAGRD